MNLSGQRMEAADKERNCEIFSLFSNEGSQSMYKCRLYRNLREYIVIAMGKFC